MRSRIVIAALLLSASVGCKDVYEGPRSDGGSGFDPCRPAGTLLLPAIGGGSSVSGDTAGNPNQLDSTCGGNGPDEAWVLTIPSPGEVVLEITDASFDTVLHIHTSCSGDALFCDDDGGSGALSRIETFLAPGRYYVVVDGYGSTSSGSYTLELDNVSVATSTTTDAGAERSVLEICTDACADGCAFASVEECVVESGCLDLLRSCDPFGRSMVESCLAAGPSCGLDCVATSCGP